MQTQIRLLLVEQSDHGLRCRCSLIWVYTVCHSVCMVWTHYSMVEPHSSNFRVITTNFLGVRIFRKITVCRVSFAHAFCTVHWKINSSHLVTKHKMACAPSEDSDQPGIHPVLSESSLCTQWVAKDPGFLHADSEDSDQTRWMPRLIWVLSGHTCHFVGFVTWRLI